MIFKKKLIGGILALFFLAFLISILEVPIWQLGRSLKKPSRPVPTNTLHHLEFFSKEILIDRLYPPDEGPVEGGQMSLLPGQEPELVWIRGFSVTPVSPDGKVELSNEFLYYSNLDFVDFVSHRQFLGGNPIGTYRLFALSQGQNRVEFPSGFGIPIMSNELLQWNVIAMNLNLSNRSLNLKFKLTIDYFLDQDVSTPLKPLFVVNAVVAKLLYGRDGYFGVEKPGELIREAESSRGVHALEGERYILSDGKERKFSLYWIVEPGREVDHTLATRFLNLPFDTTFHYANAHLYPYAESLELKDLSTHQFVFKGKASQVEKGIGLAHVDELSSMEGIPIFKDHEYDLISIYRNPTLKDQKAMATLFLYLLDKEFKRPTNQ